MAGLLQDLLGDRDLADVVQQRGELELLAASSPRCRCWSATRVDEVDDRARVVGGVGVVVLDDVGEQHHRAAVGALELERRGVALAAVAREDVEQPDQRADRDEQSDGCSSRGERDRQRHGSEDRVDAGDADVVVHDRAERDAGRQAVADQASRRSRTASCAASASDVDADVRRAAARRGRARPARARGRRRTRSRRSAPSQRSRCQLPRTKSGSSERSAAAATSSGTSGSGASSSSGTNSELLRHDVAVAELEAHAGGDRVADHDRADQQRVDGALVGQRAPRSRSRRARSRPPTRRRPAARGGCMRCGCRARASPTSCSDRHYDASSSTPTVPAQCWSFGRHLAICRALSHLDEACSDVLAGAQRA